MQTADTPNKTSNDLFQNYPAPLIDPSPHLHAARPPSRIVSEQSNLSREYAEQGHEPRQPNNFAEFLHQSRNNRSADLLSMPSRDNHLGQNIGRNPNFQNRAFPPTVQNLNHEKFANIIKSWNLRFKCRIIHLPS